MKYLLLIGLLFTGLAHAHNREELHSYYMERSRMEGTPNNIRKLGDSHSLAELRKMQFEIDNAVHYKELGIKTQARHAELKRALKAKIEKNSEK